MSHTEGRLRQDEYQNVLTESGQRFRLVGVSQAGGNTNQEEAEANARRLVAAWNATLGIPTSALESGCLAELREAAREALEEMENCAGGECEPQSCSWEVRERLSAALARLEGEG